MDSRSTILNRIKNALADVDRTLLIEPETPEIWPVTGKSSEELVSVFSDNLTAVAGQVILCQNSNDAIVKLSNLLQDISEGSEQKKSFQLGVYNSELANTIALKLTELNNNWEALYTPSDVAIDPRFYASMTASLVSPFLLIADTGSCAIEGRSAFERLLCYLSPICIVVAKASQLRENLPHAWPEIETKMKNPTQHGELALVTGPSRTADIEKKLVLGVHGPQRLIVFIIQNE